MQPEVIEGTPPKPPTDGINSLYPWNHFLRPSWDPIREQPFTGRRRIRYERVPNWHESRIAAPNVPTRIDQFLQANMSAWYDPHSRLPDDHALCEVFRGYYDEIPIKGDPFPGDRVHALFLIIHFPDHGNPNSPLTCTYTSPRVVLEEWDGLRRSSQSPDWCLSLDLGDRFKFTHPRKAALALFHSTATSSSNHIYGYTEPARQWVRDVSLISRVLRTTRARSRAIRSIRTGAARPLPQTYVNRVGTRFRLVQSEGEGDEDEEPVSYTFYDY